jgi:hypothetical protein
MPAAGAVASNRSSAQPVMVWIEDAKGGIARGVAASVTSEGARVLLSGRPGFGDHDQVALRICFRAGEPTLATSARVSWIKPAADAVECALEWTATADERAAIAAGLSRAA